MILEAKDISYCYKKNKAKQILRAASMQFELGRFYAIVGPSGSGKTTFLSLLAGLDTPVAGAVLYAGEDIQSKGLNHHRKHNVSLVFQSFNLIDYLTPEENVALGGEKDPHALLREVSIAQTDWKRNVLALSGGQQQRVAIARALASDAQVLLADEPTGNLDEETTAGVIALLQKTAHGIGKCVIVVTHSKDVAMAADEVLEIRDAAILRH